MNDSQILTEIHRLTFQELDRRKDLVLNLPEAPAEGKYDAMEWYASLYTVPFGEFSEEDITRVSFQGWEPHYFVPLSLERLQTQPFAGGWYDGALLKSIGTNTPESFWEERPELRQEYCRLLNWALSMLSPEPTEESLKPEFDQSIFIDVDTRKELFEIQALLSCC